MDLLLQILVNGILQGGLYAIMALGLALVWGVLNIVNLAHGAFIMLGAYISWYLFTYAGIDPFLGLPITACVMFAVGYGIQRGLLNLRNSVDAMPELMKTNVIETFEKYKVLNERELGARYEINLETYIKTINVEAQVMVLMANRYILPAALKFQKDIAESVAAVKSAGGASKEGKKLLDKTTKLVDDFRLRTDKLATALDAHVGGTEKHAKYMRDTIVPAMNDLREIGDQLEVVMPSELWPLPTYREMLFIK